MSVAFSALRFLKASRMGKRIELVEALLSYSASCKGA
jgi:hypothetical protein